MSLPGRQPEVQGSGDSMRDGLKALFGLVDSIKERVLGRTSEALGGLKKDIDKNSERSFGGLILERVKAVFGFSDKKPTSQEGKKAPVDLNRIQRTMSDSLNNAVLIAPVVKPAPAPKPAPVPKPKEAKKEKAPKKPTSSEARFKGVLEDPSKGEWLTWAKEASAIFNVPVYLIFSIMEVESHMNPEAINEKSGAAGMGQFMPKTAKSATVFMKDKYHVDLTGLGPCKPKWDIYATAWHIRHNANALGFNPNAPDAGYWAYVCHFQGAAGARAFKAGGVYPGNMKHYPGKSEADYRELIDKLAKGVQKKSESFKRVLEAHEAEPAVASA
jgi:hypothetical protein